MGRCIIARPQLEDGHTQIANEILEHLARFYLSPNQWQVIIFIIRKTYGYKKKVDYIANFQIVEGTGLSKSVISRVLRALQERNIITRNKKHIGFQKDWEQWKLAEQSTLGTKLAEQSTLGTKLAEQSTNKSCLNSQPELAEQSTELAEQSTKVSSSDDTQKKKETIQKKLYKRKYGEFNNVLLTDKEYQQLIDRFGKAGIGERIEILSMAIESKGYKYQSHYATILNWERRERKGGTGGTRQGHTKATRTETLKASIGKPLS